MNTETSKLCELLNQREYEMKRNESKKNRKNKKKKNEINIANETFFLRCTEY